MNEADRARGSQMAPRLHLKGPLLFSPADPCFTGPQAQSNQFSDFQMNMEIEIVKCLFKFKKKINEKTKQKQ